MSMGSTNLSSLDRGDYIILNRRNIPGPNYQWILMLPLKPAPGALQREVWGPFLLDKIIQQSFLY